MKLKEILKGKIPEEKIYLVPSSYEIIGSREKAVAIIEIPEALENYKEIIAEELMKLNKNVKSVLKKVSERKGTYRLKDYEIILGEENTEVLHKEFGYFLKLDPRKVYFSSKEAYERQRIANLVKEKEFVLVMFSGIAAFPIAIAKKVNAKVFGIEINEVAHRYGVENVRINKLSDRISLILGDVKNEAEKFFGKCDRVLMPLPLESKNFLKLALKCLKGEGIIHYYTISNSLEDCEDELKEIIDRNYEIINFRKVSDYAPRVFKFCIDLRIF